MATSFQTAKATFEGVLRRAEDELRDELSDMIRLARDRPKTPGLREKMLMCERQFKAVTNLQQALQKFDTVVRTTSRNTTFD